MKSYNIKVFLLLLFFLKASYLYTQVAIKTSEGKMMAFLDNNLIVDSAKRALYTLQGNILFKEKSSHRNDILLTIETLKRKTNVYNKIENFPSWVFKKNSVYWNSKGHDFDEIISFEQRNNKTNFYYSNTDSMIGSIDTINLSIQQKIAVFYHFWNSLELEENFFQIEIEITEKNDVPDGIIALMKTVNDYSETVWLWDGEFLFPKDNNDERLVWQFDGETIKPIYNSQNHNEWSWDGEELRPFWGGHPRNNWIWEGLIFRQVFENNYKNEFELVENIARKRFGDLNDTEWVIEGEMPLGLISIVLLGIVNR